MHKQNGPGPFADEVELEVDYHSQAADSVAVSSLLMVGEFIHDHGGMTDLQLDLPYFFTNMSRTWRPTCRLRRALVGEGRRGGRISVPVVVQCAAQLDGINPPVTICIEGIKHLPPILSESVMSVEKGTSTSRSSYGHVNPKWLKLCMTYKLGNKCSGVHIYIPLRR